MYGLLVPQVLNASYLPHLVASESLLLSAIVCIAARYVAHEVDLHVRLISHIRHEITCVIDGHPNSRHISNVEALLLLAEWPALASGNRQKDLLGTYLATIRQTDALSWSYIGESADSVDVKGTDVYQVSRYDWRKSLASTRRISYRPRLKAHYTGRENGS
jgi:hypothetical protein